MRTIKVAIDVRDLHIAKTGARTYLEEVCNAFKKGYPGFSFFFIDTWLPVNPGSNKIAKIVEHLRFFCWKQFTLPAICFIKGYDILFCTDYVSPVLKPGFKTAVVFHDAFFWEYPAHYNSLWLGMMKTIGLAGAKRADAIITVTGYAKAQIVKHLGINPLKIHPVHLAPKTSATRPGNLVPAIIQNRKYILHVGVLEKRKNLSALIRAYAMLPEAALKEYDLVLTGTSVPKKNIDDGKAIRELISELGLQNKVILAGFVPDDQLAWYYRYATVYAFVSINEGFGIPVLEAFQNNLPILIAGNTSLPEVAGDAAITCDPFDTKDIRDKLDLILKDQELRNQLIEKGQNRLKAFSWDATARGILSVFTQIKV
jgi:glycosyltransferase involved in cell wall biosynthesis